ncbi:MAG: hypothetical protein NT062_20675 [Proteobacteria bacterium]|nr:hypothetical protein [Pseudomonadota bacterium]
MIRSVALVAALSATAFGNGRPPLTNGVFFRPGDAHSQYVRTTFGLLISHDDCTFRWVCEQNIGYGGAFDPKYAIATDGTIFATTYNGLRVSRDNGCTFTTATADAPVGDPGRIAELWIDAIDIGPTGEIWVATADSGHPNNVYRSTDNGVTFAPRGMSSPTIWWKSVLVAPTDPQRAYVTGYQVAGVAPDGGQLPPTAHLMRTDDGGATWFESPLAGVTLGQQAVSYVVGVSPTDADTILYATEYSHPPSGDRLYRSRDGGATLTEVLATTSHIHNVTFLDASTVVVAAGPADSFISVDGGATFAPLKGYLDAQNNAPQLDCVGKRGDELFGCGANWNPDFKAIVRSTDAAHWTKVTRFVEIAGPLECPAGTPGADVCAPLWSGSGGLQEQFGTTGPACNGTPVVPDVTPVKKPAGGCCDAGDVGSSGSLAALVGLAARRRRRR